MMLLLMKCSSAACRDMKPSSINLYAQQDLEDIRRQVIGAKFRVSSPGWDVPSEIWRMVVWPSRVRNARTAGLGADNIIQGALA